MKQALDHKG